MSEEFERLMRRLDKMPTNAEWLTAGLVTVLAIIMGMLAMLFVIAGRL